MSNSPPINRSEASLSPSASQSHPDDIPLEALVSHLLASKRSLSSISTVWRANEIVTSARLSLEESVKLSARTGFLRSGIAEQAKLLRKVRAGVEDVYKEGQRDFKVCKLHIKHDLSLIDNTGSNSNTRWSKFTARVDNACAAVYHG